MKEMNAAKRPIPDWENFGKAITETWPTGDFNGADLFDLCLTHGLIEEVPGGYNPELHVDADGVCPETGDPWYEYTFRGAAGPGLYSVQKLQAEARDKALEKKGWQPIETAPKDGLIDIWLSDGVRWCDCYYDRICEEWRTSRPSGKLLAIKEKFVTHWMQRPRPPKEGGA